MVMMVKHKPLLLKLGVALALTFAGFLYSHFRSRSIRPTHSTPSPSSASGDSKTNVGGKMGLQRDLHYVQMRPCCGIAASILPEYYEDAAHQKVITDNPVLQLSPSSKHSKDEEGFLLPEFNEELDEFEFTTTNTGISPRKDVGTPTTFKKEADKETNQEIIKLRNMVRVVRERETKLEFQLLEYYGHKEQETAVMELQNRLKINNVEAKLFTLKIESLQADNRRMEAHVADYSRVVGELESARAKIKMLKKKIRSDGEQNKEHIYALQQRVANLQDQEHTDASNNTDIQKKLQRLKELESESEELRKANLRLKELESESEELVRTNSRLQCDNSELARKLESTQILAASFLEPREAEALQEANQHLRQENDDLAKEIEQLQANRCADVEELVYLRWVNACLRYELRNYQAPPGKTVARDLSKTLSPRSEEKAKQLILEYANSERLQNKGTSIMDIDSEYWSSSQTSNLTEASEFDDSSVDLSSPTRTSSTSKKKLFSKLKKLILRKENYHNNNHTSSADRTTTGCEALVKRESVSTGSSEDVMGTYSCGTLSSNCNSNISVTALTDIEAKINERMNSIITPSQSSSRASLDIQGLRNPNLEDIRNVESARRNSDVGSSYGYKKMIFREGGVIGFPRDNLLNQDQGSPEKLKLMKFAEVLKDSGNSHSHRKSTTYSAY